MSDRYTVDTPENIELSYEIGGIGSRFLAAILDSVLILTLELFALYVFGLATELLEQFTSQIAAIGALLTFLILWGYYLFFELIWSGQSPGKRVIGLRVVREGGRPITVSGAAIRNLIRVIDFLPFGYGVGVVVMFIDSRARRLGDLAAGTLVVKERRGVSLEALLSETTAHDPVSPLPAGQAPVATIDRLDDADYELIRDFLTRRRRLDREVRKQLAADIAAELQRRLEIPPGEPEPLIEYVAAAFLHRRRTGATSDIASGNETATQV
jgi:uncharacterized RDD family membrane protein YckC